MWRISPIWFYGLLEVSARVGRVGVHVGVQEGASEWLKTDDTYCTSESSKKIREGKESWEQCRKSCDGDTNCRFYAAMKLKDSGDKFCVLYENCGTRKKHAFHSGDLYEKQEVFMIFIAIVLAAWMSTEFVNDFQIDVKVFRFLLRID